MIWPRAVTSVRIISALETATMPVFQSDKSACFCYTHTMGDLPSLRQKIDSLDTIIVNLLNERAQVSLDIGATKKSQAAENTSGR
jgi:hypothetical protein